MARHKDWLPIAVAEIGVKERPGTDHNSRILDYHATTTLAAASDEVAWCSAFANWVMGQAGLEGTRSAAARSWMAWGRELAAPRQGCVVVFWRGRLDSAQGHVGFYMGEDSKGRILCLGGNQSNEVNVSPQPKDRVLGYRWPIGVSTDAPAAAQAPAPEPAPKPLARSRSLWGAGTTALGGAAVLAEPAERVVQAVVEGEKYLEKGTIIGLFVGAVIIVGAVVVAYARIDDRKKKGR